jgi:hypothetical protein
MVRRYVLVSLVLAAALGAAAAFACGDGEADETAPGTPTGVPEATPTLVAVIDGPGDQVLNAALASDTIELARLTGYSTMPCEPPKEASDAALACRLDEEPGDEIHVLRVTRCEPGWIRPEVVADTYRDILTDGPQLVAVYRPRAAEADDAELAAVDHVAVFRTEDRPDGTHFGAALHLVGGRVVHAEEPCISILQLLFGERVESWELAPGELPRIVP